MSDFSLTIYQATRALATYAKKSVLDSYLTYLEIDDYAKKNLLDSYLTIADIPDGYIGFKKQELDPATTTGSDTQIILPYAPVNANALYVYKNGMLMRKVSALGTSKQEYTLSGNIVTFVADGSAGNWYNAQYIDSYQAVGASNLVDVPAALKGAKPVIDTTNDRFVYGYYDNFTGSTLNSQWTKYGTGGTNSFTVTGGYLQIYDANDGGGDPVVAINNIIPSMPFDVWANVQIVNTGSGNQANGINVYSGTRNLRLEFAYASGFKLWVRGGDPTMDYYDASPAGSTNPLWIRIVYMGGYIRFCYSTNAYTDEPNNNDWVVSRTISTTEWNAILDPTTIQLATNNYATGTATTRWRSFRFRYL